MDLSQTVDRLIPSTQGRLRFFDEKKLMKMSFDTRVTPLDM